VGRVPGHEEKIQMTSKVKSGQQMDSPSGSFPPGIQEDDCSI
jgi:hypothetical protein